MDSIAEFDVYPLKFHRTGEIAQTDEVTESFLRGIAGKDVSDLLVMSHGWNNTMQEATGLYTELLTSMRELVGSKQHSLGTRKVVVATIYWPSQRFVEEALQTGGSAAAGQPETAIHKQIDGLIGLFDGKNEFKCPPDHETVNVLRALKTLVPHLDAGGDAAGDFARQLRSLFPHDVNQEEEVFDATFFTTDGAELLERLGRPLRPRVQAVGGAAVAIAPLDNPQLADGGAAGLGNLFQGIKNGANNLLTLFTYYQMKERAGLIGRTGLGNLFVKIKTASPNLRVHFAGHSFGGRLVTSALASSDNPFRASSIALLQSAFSHWGFAQRYDGQRDGLFRGAIFSDDVANGRLAGPMVITHTPNDWAVGVAYPLASRLRNQVASRLGDAKDPFGGIGRNGAQLTPEVKPDEKTLREIDSPYTGLAAGTISNLESSQFIKSHGDVRGKQVAHAILSAMSVAQ